MKENFTGTSNRNLLPVLGVLFIILAIVFLVFEGVNEKVFDLHSLFKKSPLVEEQYSIWKNGDMYYYELYDRNGVIVKQGGPFPQEPSININKSIIMISYQAGTGNATRWGFFFDTEGGQISDVYYNILDETEAFVAYADYEKVVVRSIFDKSFYIEFFYFSQDFSPTANPFIKANIDSRQGRIEISYYAGLDFHENTDVFFWDTGTYGTGDGSSSHEENSK